MILRGDSGYNLISFLDEMSIFPLTLHYKLLKNALIFICLSKGIPS